MNNLKATVLIDNIPDQGLLGEWGLSIFIEYGDKHILLDTGGSGKFVENAKALGIDLKTVDYGVLSHAHYDHSNGMKAFFEENDSASFYLREGSGENCYAKRLFFKAYIGIKRGTLTTYSDRITFAKDNTELCPGVKLIPHSTPGLEEKGRHYGMYVKKDGKLKLDDFSHEQSLVFETPKGLVVFNSCSHGGVEAILSEVQAAYPGEKIYALIGGFHLASESKKTVQDLADKIKDLAVEKIITGHCTGQKSYAILKETLGDKAEQLRTGMVITAE